VSAPAADAVLVLEDGRSFPGASFGAVGQAFGEAVFCTAMTGYQETLTDPSYRRQVVVMTAPHIGNTGVNAEDAESGRIWVSGLVVREPPRRASSWRSTGGLAEELAAQGVVGISGVDTRALTRHLRERGAMRAGISSSGRSSTALLAQVREQPVMAGADLVSDVSTPQAYVVPAVGPRRFRVAALDLGVKTSSLRWLAASGVEVHVLPASAGIEDIAAVEADGVFFSNGPGDPAAAAAPVALLRELLDREIPYFGICLGHQLLGRAAGRSTYKLRYGHRGVNQPVRDLRTGRIEVTSHNHGFAVDAPVGGRFDTPYGPAEVSQVGLNDGVVEGIRLLDVPAFSVQYHPEAAAGPHDAGHLFERFVAMLAGSR
jgi:carbamoyl-phosphate synthase small subunit